MPIRVLANDVISKISAGEVVERPASVVKELVENSIDAGANQIAIEINGGGIQLIRVTDNGMGIPADEVELSFERHATNKITSETDLESVTSLGFRGEALPSIAAVADVSMITRYRDDIAGTAIRLENGIVTGKVKQGSPQGTSLTIRNLFLNVPARLKFLKSVPTENGHISHLITQYSMAFPEVKFTLSIGDRVTIRTPGNGALRDVLVEAYGLEAAQSMLEISAGFESLVCLTKGLISPPSLSRANRNYLSFFVNRRWVRSRMLTYAVEEAYQGMLMTGKHPIVVLDISLPPQDIDINVHPAKSEIRFRRDREIFSAVQKSVRDTLVGSAPIPSRRVLYPPSSTSFPELLPAGTQRTGAPATSQPKLKEERTQPFPHLPILRVIGQFQKTYIVAEGPDGLYLVDQHAAHERILFERLIEQQSRLAIEVQGLIEPMTVEVTAQQEEYIRSQGDALSKYGFSLERFGERTYLLRSVPAVLKRQDVDRILVDILDSLGGFKDSEWQQGIAISLACHGAILAGQTLSLPEMEELIQQLEGSQLPRTCPHGRPTMINIGASQMEREFGRR